MSSGANSILDISSAWSANGSGGRRGGASGCVRAARSVAVRSSSVSVANATEAWGLMSLHTREIWTGRTDWYRSVLLILRRYDGERRGHHLQHGGKRPPRPRATSRTDYARALFV
jgi:hypothetical protein